jgi:hypothetical protein
MVSPEFTIAKAIVAFLLVAATVVQGLLDYRFHDKRTRSFKKLRVVNFVVLAVAAAGIVPITIYDSREIAALRTDIATLSANVAPRSLSDERRAILIKRLAALIPRQILVTASTGSDESLRFAGELRSAFADAGWEVLGPGQKSYGGLADGLVLFASGEVPTELVREISAAFAAADLNVAIMPQRGAAIALDAPASPLELFTGVK